jgi:hypothetical protein
LAAAGSSAQNRVSLWPQLHEGQKLTYQIRLRIDKHTRTESRVAAPAAPLEAPADILRTVEVEVLDVGSDSPPSKLLLRLQLRDPSVTQSAAKAVELAFRPDGSVVPPPNTSELSADDNQVWQAWLDRFTFAWSLPAKSVKLGEKWSAEEPISGTLLAALFWEKESQYVRDEKCPGASKEGERCAVLLTTATLKQRSSAKDSTPDDFKVRQLKTRGTAKGRNETFTYIALASGLVIRSSEEAHQFMDVIVLKADGSNQVHYNIEASSSTEMLLLEE